MSDIERFDDQPEITWKIHGVMIQGEEGYEDKEFIANYHTHGFDAYGHREMCIVLDIEDKIAAEILNNTGLRIAGNKASYKEGKCHDILQNDYDVEFISFSGDPTLYMMLPDPNNLFPEDEGCIEPYKYQYEYAELISKNKDYV